MSNFTRRLKQCLKRFLFARPLPHAFLYLSWCFSQCLEFIKGVKRDKRGRLQITDNDAGLMKRMEKFHQHLRGMDACDPPQSLSITPYSRKQKGPTETRCFICMLKWQWLLIGKGLSAPHLSIVNKICVLSILPLATNAKQIDGVHLGINKMHL